MQTPTTMYTHVPTLIGVSVVLPQVPSSKQLYVRHSLSASHLSPIAFAWTHTSCCASQYKPTLQLPLSL